MKYDIVFKTQCLDAMLIQQFLFTSPISIWHIHVIMIISIQFDCKFQCRTVKIQYISSNTILATEL